LARNNARSAPRLTSNSPAVDNADVADDAPLLIEGRDYVIDAEGRLMFTARYLRQRGACCGNGCRHCPFDHVNVPEPRRAMLRAARRVAAETK
jgi:hypothetical protein